MGRRLAKKEPKAATPPGLGVAAATPSAIPTFRPFGTAIAFSILGSVSPGKIFPPPGGMGMSVQSVSASSSNDWLQQLLAMYGQTSATNSTTSSLLSLGSDATDATSSSSSSSSSASSSSSSSVGSFNDILTALLAGNGSLSYDMSTGSLTTSGADGEESGGGDLTRTETQTTNADGSTTTSATMTDSSGNTVGKETTTENTDGSFTTTITMTDPNGKTSTRTITGENTSDGGYKVTDTLTAADGTVLETGTEVAAADGSVTRTMTSNNPDGSSVTESESYDASGELVSMSSSSTSSSSAASSSATSSNASTLSSASSSSSSSSSSGSGGSSSSSSSDTTTTVTMTFTSEGIQETTTVTDADGKIVSQNTKEIPFSSTAESSSLGATESSKKGLAGLLSEYAANRYGSDQYSNQETAMNMVGGSSVSLEA
jgi:hypothetical protein